MNIERRQYMVHSNEPSTAGPDTELGAADRDDDPEEMARTIYVDSEVRVSG